MCLFPSKLVGIKAPLTAKAKAFFAKCKLEGKNPTLEILKRNKKEGE